MLLWEFAKASVCQKILLVSLKILHKLPKLEVWKAPTCSVNPDKYILLPMAYLEPCKIFKMVHFQRPVHSSQPLNIFEKLLHLRCLTRLWIYICLHLMVLHIIVGTNFLWSLSLFKLHVNKALHQGCLSNFFITFYLKKYLIKQGEKGKLKIWKTIYFLIPLTLSVLSFSRFCWKFQIIYP